MSFHNLIMSVPELCRESSSSPVSPLIPLSVSESSRCKNDLLTSVKRYFEQVGATVDGKNNNIAGTDGVYRLMINASRELGLQDPEWQLRRYPSETIDWPAHNSDRIDVSPPVFSLAPLFCLRACGNFVCQGEAERRLGALPFECLWSPFCHR